MHKNTSRQFSRNGEAMKKQNLNDNRDNRGFVVNPFDHLDNTGEITNCHAFSIEPGCSRGNHAHPARNEQVLVLSGTVTVRSTAGDTVLSSDHPAILTIPDGMEHLFLNITDRTAIVMCWSSKRKAEYSGSDTVRTELPGN
jgi:dTDP-4-dehydrorhamnose 3,5-epimerase-like enzyme